MAMASAFCRIERGTALSSAAHHLASTTRWRSRTRDGFAHFRLARHEDRQAAQRRDDRGVMIQLVEERTWDLRSWSGVMASSRSADDLQLAVRPVAMPLAFAA